LLQRRLYGLYQYLGHLTEFRTCFTHSSFIFSSRASAVAENNPKVGLVLKPVEVKHVWCPT
jgi:hypothetical protein